MKMKNSFFLKADMLPEGVAQNLKAGDTVQLKCVAPIDKEGEVEVECCDASGEAGGDYAEEANEPGEAEGKSWDDEAREALSPRSGDEESA